VESTTVPCISVSPGLRVLKQVPANSGRLDEHAVIQKPKSPTTYPKPMAVRADPPHALYGSWEDVEACKKEYIQKPPYEVTIGVKQVRVRLHHNPKARPHAYLSCIQATREP
jgi:hypothetical protein